jgi:hypothetical protein
VQLGTPPPTPKTTHPYSTAAVIVACVAIIGYWGWVGVTMVDLGERMARVETNVQPFALKQISYFDQKTFERSLPQLRQVIEQSNPKPVADRETLTIIANRLRQTNESAPDYWPTVLQFIQFASSALTLPTDVPPPGSRYSKTSNVLCGNTVHCIEAAHSNILLDGGDIRASRFENCRIRFTQNPVKMSRVQFINCVFEMPVTNDPTPYLKDAARQLLASNLTSVSIPSS